MKSRSQVIKKLRDVKYRYLHKKFKNQLKVSHRNCIHNYTHVGKDTEDMDTEVGLCLLGSSNPEEWKGTICDEDVQAQSCPFFKNKFSKDVMLRSFYEELEDETVVSAEYKDIAALQWVIGERVCDWDLTRWQRVKIHFFYLVYKVTYHFRGM